MLIVVLSISSISTMSPSDSLPAGGQLHLAGLYAPCLRLTQACGVGSPQFWCRTFVCMPPPLHRRVHRRCIPSSSRLLWPSPMFPRLGSLFCPRVSEVLFNDAAEFTLCYGLHLCSPCFLDRYFILPLSTPHLCDALRISYPAPWRLPGRDFHPQVRPSFAGRAQQKRLVKLLFTSP